MDIIEQINPNTIRHPWELARLAILMELVRDYLPFDNQLKTVVDVGCGDCFFATELLRSRQDVSIIAIDPAYTSDDLIRKKEEINDPRFSIFRTIKDAAGFLAQQPANLVLLLDVIEHIGNDVSFLQEVKTAFTNKNETTFIISVPAHRFLFTQHDKFLKHFRRYNVRSIRRTVIEADLVPKASGYFFASLLPVRFIQKMIELMGIKTKQKGIGNWKGSAFVTGLFKNYLLFDFKISKLLGKAGIDLPGLSAYCICKKPAS